MVVVAAVAAVVVVVAAAPVFANLGGILAARRAAAVGSSRSSYRSENDKSDQINGISATDNRADHRQRKRDGANRTAAIRHVLRYSVRMRHAVHTISEVDRLPIDGYLRAFNH